MRAQERIFSEIFLEKTDKEISDFYERKIYLKTIDDIRNHFKRSFDNYLNINKLIISKAVIPVKSIKAEFFFTNQNIFNRSIEYNFQPYINQTDITLDLSNKEIKMILFSNFNITVENNGPFSLSNSKLKEFLKDVKFFQLHFPIFTYHNDIYTEKEICNKWVKLY